ncbi:UbiA family prenyltransferase [Oerskovia sp. M15]
MALNDYADRELDAVERPERPLPSGRVSPEQALGVATGLTAAGLVLAGAGEGDVRSSWRSRSPRACGRTTWSPRTTRRARSSWRPAGVWTS